MKILVSILLLFFVACVNAQSLKVDVNKAIFYPGDEIVVTVTLENNNARPIIWNVNCDFISEVSSLPPLLYLEEISVNPFDTKTLNFTVRVWETMPSGPWKAVINVKNGSEVITSEQKSFEVRGTKKVIDAELKTCIDDNCEGKIDVFVLGEYVYVRLFSDIPLEIDAVLETPETIEPLSFTNDMALVKPEIVGEYKITATLSKEGYKTTERTLHFAVIKEDPVVKDISLCNADGTCAGEEHYQNCPQDCPSGSNDGYCDKISDRRCDPDCLQGEDMDCGSALSLHTLILLVLIIFLGGAGFILSKNRLISK